MNSNSDAANSISVLEQNLDCKAITFEKSEDTEVRQFATKCKEDTILFDDGDLVDNVNIIDCNSMFLELPTGQNCLWMEHNCEQLIQHIPMFSEKIHSQYLFLMNTEGKWVADFFYMYCIACLKSSLEKPIAKSSIYEGENQEELGDLTALAELFPELSTGQDEKVKEIVANLHYRLVVVREAEIAGQWASLKTLSPKVHALVELLITYRFNEEFRGIVFVETRRMAITLSQIISSHPGLKHIRSSYLIGHGAGAHDNPNRKVHAGNVDQGSISSSKFGKYSMGIPYQKKTVDMFRSGELNVMISTSVSRTIACVLYGVSACV